eukprot:1160224-Pelagomonas_calceolata.AAC.20
MKQGHQLLAIKMEASLCPLSTESRAIQEAAALQHCLSLPSLLCKLARVWGQKAGKIPAEMGSSRRRPLACLTSSNGWTPHQSISWGSGRLQCGGAGNRPILAGKSPNLCEKR